MKHYLTLAGALLSGILLLAACGPTGTTSDGTTVDSGVAIKPPSASGLTTTVRRALTLGTGDNSVLLDIFGVVSATATVNVVSGPAGLTATVGTLSNPSSAETLVKLNIVPGSARAGDLVTFGVTLNGKTATVQVPVMAFTTEAISAAGLSSRYQAGTMRTQPDGTLLLSSSLSGSVTERHSLVKYDPATHTFSVIAFPITLPGEAITSQTTMPDGTIWVSVRGLSAEGSYLIVRRPDSTFKTYLVGAPNDTVNNLTTTSDGRIWFTQNKAASVKALTPATGSVEAFAVTEKADSLVRGTDGKLYYAAFYARPAIVQLDPASGQSKSFNVGDAGVSLPLALTAASDGSIWFTESRTGSVWHLNPSTGTQTPFTLPSGVRPTELTFDSAQNLWVSDATNALLYTAFSTDGSKGKETNVTGFGAVTNNGTPAGPSALTTGPDGKIWYVAAGQLVHQQ
ncbi:hypothetical protein [Deinococcus sp.]|uniref:Vgb family protein n=1 Tax=Deinococcus sp. TaxID=47478 RepID=UPI0025BCB489|nr:hypothetical protein [Deinococcus sp.]